MMYIVLLASQRVAISRDNSSDAFGGIGPDNITSISSGGKR